MDTGRWWTLSALAAGPAFVAMLATSGCGSSGGGSSPDDSPTPTVTATASPTRTPTPLGTPDLVAAGARLFFQETFDGNGRTCGTCHPAATGFTLTPAFIAGLPAGDPLFVAERVPALAELENPGLMHGPRALILENVDGFDQPPVFRGVPHIFNLELTAPFGWSGSVQTLAEFATRAVTQHFPRTLARVPGVDFRLPTADELDALVAFMLSLPLPADRVLDVNAFVVTPAQARGRDLFFENAKCSFCHVGPVLTDNSFFNTGVVNLPVNRVAPPECDPPCSAIGPRELGGNRAFNVRP